MNTLAMIVLGWAIALAGVAALAVVIEHVMHYRKTARQDRLFDDIEAAAPSAHRSSYTGASHPRSRA